MSYDDDAASILQHHLDDLLIYEPGDILSITPVRPPKEDLASIESATAMRALHVLRRYVRPRNEVLRIRRAVNAALAEDNVGEGNVYSRYLDCKRDVEELNVEKAEIGERLEEIRGKPVNGNDARNGLLGNIVLRKTEKQVNMLRIYRSHLQLLVGETEQADNQVILVRPWLQKTDVVTDKTSRNVTIAIILCKTGFSGNVRRRSSAKTKRPLPIHPIIETETNPPIPRLPNPLIHPGPPKTIPRHRPDPSQN
jgi:hypothetical protein